MTTRVRDWATVDYYQVLGCSPGASSDEVARAFRIIAKQLHPDTNDDPGAIERFKDVSAAYSVLSDDALRRDYDIVRAGIAAAPVDEHVAPVRTAPMRPARKSWSRAKCLTALVSGILLTLLGLLALGTTWVLHNNDANERARFLPVTATRVENGQIVFQTRDDQRITTKEPKRRGDPTGAGPTVQVRYDPANPQHVIVDSSTLARDLTFAIVGLKLLVGGIVFAVVGGRRLGRVTAVRRS